MGFFVALIFAFAAACGSEEPTDEDRLIGLWGAVVQTPAPGCLLYVDFAGDDRYGLDVVCQLASRSYATQSESGTYTVAGQQVTFMPDRTTCPVEGAADPATAVFEFLDSDSLRLLFPSYGIVLDEVRPVAENTGGATVAFGCWNDDATFTPGEVQAL